MKDSMDENLGTVNVEKHTPIADTQTIGWNKVD